MPGCSPRSPTKTAYSFSTNRCWARDRRDDDPPRRNSAGRRLRNFAPKVTVELQTELEASSERALRSVNRRNCWRRRQDSNLRALAGQRFSRPPPSASRPLLRANDSSRLRRRSAAVSSEWFPRRPYFALVLRHIEIRQQQAKWNGPSAESGKKVGHQLLHVPRPDGAACDADPLAHGEP